MARRLDGLDDAVRSTTRHRSWTARSVGSAGLACALLAGCGGTPADDDDATPDGGAGAWQVVHENLPGAVLDAWPVAEDDVYFVGGSADPADGKGPLALHFDGTTWRRLQTGVATGSLWWVFSVDPGRIFMAGDNGVILSYNPTTGIFGTETTPGAETIFGLWGVAANDLWAVGGQLSGSPHGVIWHFDGTSWVDQTPPPAGGGTTDVLFKVVGRSANDVFAVGNEGLTFHFDGTDWTELSPAAATLFTVAADPTVVVGVGGLGNGLIVELDGLAWQDVSPVGEEQLNGVYTTQACGAIAAGLAGGIFRRTDGVWTQDETVPTQRDFHAVVTDSACNVWATGGNILFEPLINGIITHFGSPVPGGAIEGI